MRFGAALLDAGLDRDEIGLVADAEMAEEVLATAPGALAILPAVGTLWIAPTLVVDAADPPHLDLPLGRGRAFWLVRHREALTAWPPRSDPVITEVRSWDRNASAGRWP